ncbi:ATP-binding protein [Amycolatopsis sp. K13G38]|uniref:ATP-binding protein n=1 Tax=Amycolatopsis acididurans TaxID=2724524 RepID=A0ABX1JD80_9PSEU|nr:ATP-binding protein [Amycolatopsis acididurans]NKQ57747.1 ATP-binding protein [Amycolatopsis acididurans]
MANVVTRADPDATSGTMTVTAGPDGLMVTVTDNRRCHDNPSSSHAGLGLPLIPALAPESSSTTGPTGTTVRMHWPTPTTLS